MAQSTSLISGVTGRYAGSLFELAAAQNAVDKTEADLGRFEALINGSAELARVIKSPVYSAEDQLKAVASIADKAKIGGLAGNFLRIVAKNRRLAALGGMIGAFRLIAAEARGQASADVISAQALSAAQEKDLKAALKSVSGKDVAVNVTIDPSILGGLIVKMGSRQIDTSLKTKLASLKLALKEVG